jgi:hypothetical protein
MYILTVTSNEIGAYAVEDKHGEKVLYMFQEQDDALRYLIMLEELEYPTMEITEVNPNVAFAACDRMNYQYAIITPEDIIIPPDYDNIHQTKI